MDTSRYAVLPIGKTTEQFTEMVRLAKQAFGPDPLVEFCFNRPNVPQRPEPEHVAGHLKHSYDPRYIYHKAVDVADPDGPMLGVAAWYQVDDPQDPEVHIPWGPPAVGVHIECYEASLGTIRRWRRDHFRERNQPFLYMALLCVRPDMQRRGVGQALLRAGLSLADQQGTPSFIEASPAGVGLYKKFGWEPVMTSTVNLRDFGGEDISCDAVAMIRPAGAKETL